MPLQTDHIAAPDFLERLHDAAEEFHALAQADPPGYRLKLQGPIHHFVMGDISGPCAPLSWLMARLDGIAWDQTNRRGHARMTKAIKRALHKTGLREITVGTPDHDRIEHRYIEQCRTCRGGLQRKLIEKGGRTYWVGPASEARRTQGSGNGFPPAETPDPTELWPSLAERYAEGTVQQALVNRYERSAAARRRCIEHHGCRCAACGFDFEDGYGLLGNGFIHVHHLIPLAEISGSYDVDPVKDLVPLCPNCHAMVHRLDDPTDLGALQAAIRFVTSAPKRSQL